MIVDAVEAVALPPLRLTSTAGDPYAFLRKRTPPPTSLVVGHVLPPSYL